MATCGLSAGAGQVYEAFVAAVKEAGLEDVEVKPTGCVGRCDLEPLVEVTRGMESPVMYVRVDPEKAKEIVQKHLVGGKVVEEYLD
jgi:(2Fe-2S) ferredoxin